MPSSRPWVCILFLSSHHHIADSLRSCRTRPFDYSTTGPASAAWPSTRTTSWLSWWHARCISARHSRLQLPPAHPLRQPRPQRHQARELRLGQHPGCAGQGARFCSPEGSCLRRASRYSRALVWLRCPTANLHSNSPSRRSATERKAISAFSIALAISAAARACA